ncbi:hypothetical protein [Streptomyces poriticola]|uniref:hypothetical protein n=1 Tax=Streptomyces poriticola TaxID=3120506 RepID=UPI002FCE01D8
MRRTARALSAAVVLAGAALTAGAAPGLAGPGADPEPLPVPVAPEHRAGTGEPAAEVSPATVEPGGTVTVSVSCPATGGTAPDTLDAVSEAFDEGTVELPKAPAEDGDVSGPAYHGSARLAPADSFEGDPAAAGPDSGWSVDGTCPGAPGGEGRPWSATITVTGVSGGAEPCPKPVQPGEHGDKAAGDPCAEPACPEPARSGGLGGKQSGDEQSGGKQSSDMESGGKQAGDKLGGDKGSGVDCAAEPAYSEPAYSEPLCSELRDHSCAKTAHPQGVHAGAGGAFTDSVPALVAGGALIAGAGGLAAHRLLRGRGRGAHR